MLNPKLHEELTNIAMTYPKAVFRHRYIGSPGYSFSLPCEMLDDRIDQVCNDHSIDKVQVKMEPGGEWYTFEQD